MRVSIVIAFATTLALGSAKKINMHCGFAADKTAMIQQPYCCRDMQPAMNNAKANEAEDCLSSFCSSFFSCNADFDHRCPVAAAPVVRGPVAAGVLLRNRELAFPLYTNI